MRQLYLASTGYSRPDTRLFDSISLGDDVVSFPIPDIRTALTPEYLSETKNEDPFQVMPALLATPTSLGAEAARQALQFGKREPQSLGLILGATCTPLQTTPTESQRVGKELGVKIPAYDIQAGGADFALHLETLLSWKESSLPENTLILSSHIPTSRIDFREESIEQAVFSDGAGAAVVSTVKSDLRVKTAVAKTFPSLGKHWTIDLYGHLEVNLGIEREVFVPRLLELINEHGSLISEDALFIESQLTPQSFSQLQEAVGIGKWHSSFNDLGNMFGASPFAALRYFQTKEEMDAEQIVILLSGAGLSIGIIILEREG